MGWIERAISFVSPKWGFAREMWRRQLDIARSYDAGSGGRLNAGWRVTNSSAEITDRYQRDTIRARGRDLERNSDFLKGVLSAFKRNVVGAGFQLQAKTDDDELNTRIEQLWNEWCSPRNCDVSGQQSFTDMCRMAVVRKRVDGGIIFIKCYNNSGVLPFSLQALEVDELDSGSMNLKPRKSGNRIAGGIEYNQYNAPVGYYIKKYDIDGFTSIAPEYIEAKDVIFYWSKSRPSQIREISEIAATLPRIRDIGEYIEAVSRKERITACLAVFIKKMIPRNSIGRDYKDSGSGESPYDGLVLEPGMITELSPEDDIEVVNPAGQGQSAADFVRLQQRLLSAGQGLSYETVSRDMSQVNYSSARQGLIEDEMTYVEEQQQLKEKFMSEVYRTFIISAVLAGRLNIPDFWENKREYMRHVWVASARKWIDPLKEANANKIALQTGQKTFAQISSEGGRDWKEVIDEMSEIQEYARQKGVDLGGVFNWQKSTKQPTSE